MEIGKPGESTLFSGWLGRHLGSVAPMQANSLLRGIGIATGLQQTLVGGPQTLPIPDLDTFGLTGNSSSATARRGVLQNLYSGVGEPLYSVGLSTLQTIDLLNTINFVGYTPGGGAVYPNGGLGTAFKQTAALIRAQVGVEAIAIDYGGWDTHTNQGNTSGGTMFSLMNTLAQAMAAFNLDLSSGAAPSTTTVVMSEFGRRLQENGSLGTDHGHGNVMFVMGPCVNGGRILANWPGMGPAQLYQGIDLNVTIDFRDILAEVVQNRLGNNNLATVFPDFTPTVRGVLSC
jgi:uncharacterized protein (DUF1501 family)